MALHHVRIISNQKKSTVSANSISLMIAIESPAKIIQNVSIQPDIILLLTLNRRLGRNRVSGIPWVSHNQDLPKDTIAIPNRLRQFKKYK
jgi:hypothetical protein